MTRAQFEKGLCGTRALCWRPMCQWVVVPLWGTFILCEEQPEIDCTLIVLQSNFWQYFERDLTRLHGNSIKLYWWECYIENITLINNYYYFLLVIKKRREYNIEECNIVIYFIMLFLIKKISNRMYRIKHFYITMLFVIKKRKLSYLFFVYCKSRT